MTYIRLLLDLGRPEEALALAQGMVVKAESEGRVNRLIPLRVLQALALAALGQRELELLALLAEGLSNEEISRRLYISLNTTKWHLKSIFGKLAVGNRTQAVARARELALIP